jgi:outer membrane protein assembly factor BamB
MARRRSPLAICLLLLLLLWALFTGSGYAQEDEAAPYWQYAAAGRLSHTVPLDSNNDHNEEILVVDETGRVALLNAAGSRQWSYDAPGPITAVAIIPSASDGTGPTIALGSQRRLILLNSVGEVLWQKELTAVQPSANNGETSDDSPIQYDALPVAIAAHQSEPDTQASILVLLESGQLQMFDSSGQLLWRYLGGSNPFLSADPHLLVHDMTQNGRQEILLSSFNPRRFSQIALLNAEGELIWEQNISGRLTALTTVPFNGGEYVAAGNTRGEVLVYDANRQRLWLRTLNKPITSLIGAQLPGGPALLAGTDSGTIVAYNEEGRRVWTRNLAQNADRRILSIATPPENGQENRPYFSVILSAPDGDNDPADVLLLNDNGRTQDQFPAIDTTGLTRLVDINRDGQYELLLVRFATLELLGLSSGSSKIANEWSYSSLFAAPSAMLTLDFDQDGNDELLISARDGRLHRLDNNGSLRWIAEPGGHIAYLGSITPRSGDAPLVVVVHNDNRPGGGTPANEGVIELRQANGDQVWQREVQGEITAVLVDQLQGTNAPEIVVGTLAGAIYVFNANGEQLWRSAIEEPVQQLLIRTNPNLPQPELLAVGQQQLYRVYANKPPVVLLRHTAPISRVYEASQPNLEFNTALLNLSADGGVHGYNWRGVPLARWPISLDGQPTLSRLIQLPIDDFDLSLSQREAIFGAEALLIATSNGQLLNIQWSDDRPTIAWQLDNLPDITSIHWGDLDNDGLPEVIIGDRLGNVFVYNHNLELSGRLNVLSGVFALRTLTSNFGERADLVVLTENGLVQLFRAKENRPPLLTNPRVDATQNRFNFSVMVQDVERDEVVVRLELFDPAQDDWVTGAEQRVSGSGALFWPSITPPPDAEKIIYRFTYDDGYHSGAITPPPITPPTAFAPPPSLTGPLLFSLGVIGLGVLLYTTKQARSPAARARRFYMRIRQRPLQTLALLESRYTLANGSPEFLLNLANLARQDGDWRLSSLVDALFLLPDRPQAGLSLMENALAEAPEDWNGRYRWQATIKACQVLLDAPTVTELGLLQPQLVDLIALLETEEHWAPPLEALLPALTNLRDSQRVDRSDDRLVYLNEANAQINALRHQLADFPNSIERALAQSIVKRWSGLVGAEIEELRGQADLAIDLKTRNLTPNGRTDIVLEISNQGRAAAENICVTLDESPAYLVHSEPRQMSSLPPGRAWQVNFNLEPCVGERFRLSLKIRYDDRSRQQKEIAFGDMVQLILPARDFKPIPNPYLPGTPLRQDSLLFYGREDLFDFLSDNAKRVSQRNVLIFIGQRRTGKTSFLLRLQQHLPDNLLPVYIDCQSLGVLPGMPALLHEFAWQISDALAARQIQIDVPELADWQTDPTTHFQRRFLPQVRSLLPAETTLLLVFDEFEAFENLVNDQILPPTFFTYMRHMMQHSEGLSFIFVGTRRLEEMSADYWSVLFNVALYQKIGFLDEEAMTRLITEPVRPNLVYDDLALAKIRRVTAGHPYFLQLVCYTLVKQANSRRASYITISDVNAALEEMMRLGEVHFAYLWQRSSFAERALLTAVARLMDAKTLFRPEDLLQYLEQYGIELEPTAVTAALNSLVEREILAEVAEDRSSQYELKIGLVGLWVARNKSLSKLHAEREERV